MFKRKYPKGVIVHSDRGSQYCSKRYRNIIENYSLTGSMNRKGNCWDNSISESFFHTLKVELVYETSYKTRDIARQKLFHYIEGYYNQKRLHLLTIKPLLRLNGLVEIKSLASGEMR